MGVEEVAPVAAVGGREPVILYQHSNEEPEDDFAACDGFVEGGDLAWFLAVVVWQAEIEDEADGPEEEREGDCDAGEGGAVGYELGCYHIVEG